MRRLLVCFCTLLFCSCEKTIHIGVEDKPAKIVVDAQIENDQSPTVILSSSLNYFSTISPDELASSFVHDAVITVSDSLQTATLKEYSYTDSGYTFYYYTVQPSSPLLGKLGTNYTLNIQLKDGTTYSASTTIPPIGKTCDSLWWKPAPFNPDTNRCIMYGLFNDPPGFGDYVRYFTKVNDEPFYAGLPSAFDDEVTDGTIYTFQIPRSYSLNDTIKITDDDYSFFHRGDTVTFKFCDIDKATYDFWRTWEYAYQSNGNPFSSPIKVSGNISGDALGAFCGYAAQYRTLLIPK